MTADDPYAQALEEFEGRIERLRGRPQSESPPEEYAKLIIEEAIEADEALRKHPGPDGEPGDLVQAAKELADCLHVVWAAARRFSIPLREVFDVVHASNMTKITDEARFENHKLIKSPGFVQPYDQIREILAKADTD